MSKYDLPVIKPIRIPTSDGLRWWNKAKIWLTQSRRFEVYEDWTIPCVFEIFPDTVLDVKIFIPKGFIFDGASIPRLLWPLMSPYGILLIPALLHDYAYRYNLLYQDPGNIIVVSHACRKFWDTMFYEVAVKVNEMPFLNKLAYYGLRIGGRVAWNRHRKANLKPPSK